MKGSRLVVPGAGDLSSQRTVQSDTKIGPPGFSRKTCARPRSRAPLLGNPALCILFGGRDFHDTLGTFLREVCSAKEGGCHESRITNNVHFLLAFLRSHTSTALPRFP